LVIKAQKPMQAVSYVICAIYALDDLDRFKTMPPGAQQFYCLAEFAISSSSRRMDVIDDEICCGSVGCFKPSP